MTGSNTILEDGKQMAMYKQTKKSRRVEIYTRGETSLSEVCLIIFLEGVG